MMICSPSSPRLSRSSSIMRAAVDHGGHPCMPNFAEFSTTIGIPFQNLDLLIEAFTHRSYLNEHREYTGNHNERLEFLGDAVLELAVTDFLFKKFPAQSEGELTNYRAALVNTVSLAETAQKLDIGKYLLLSKGE